ncbi:MAG: 16S rRNA (cytosine(1402)-N(4))-methyltransferase RsmH [Clostridiales bacterium]|nr:16S rRNA (cytosine(1402)-N(4))-methyltransferase RsmH [Clostridiales bacterium]
MGLRHIPVMPNQVIEGLNIKPGGVYLDGTVGAGGHSFLIAQKLDKTGRLICMDRDAEAIKLALERLRGFSNVTFIKDNFANAKTALAGLGITGLDGVLLDLGVSSMHLDDGARGFSFQQDAEPDMRMDRDSGFSALDVVNKYSVKDMTRIFVRYGEERFAGRIARAIEQARGVSPIMSTLRLADIIAYAIPRAKWEKTKHPATRVFQAIRIEVNNELGVLERAIRDFTDMLNPSGRLLIISFNSLEDRIIKNTFNSLVEPCTCPKDMPVCICGKKPLATKITKKHIKPDAKELAANIRSRSAKLRIIEKMRTDTETT